MPGVVRVNLFFAVGSSKSTWVFCLAFIPLCEWIFNGLLLLCRYSVLCSGAFAGHAFLDILPSQTPWQPLHLQLYRWVMWRTNDNNTTTTATITRCCLCAKREDFCLFVCPCCKPWVGCRCVANALAAPSCLVIRVGHREDEQQQQNKTTQYVAPFRPLGRLHLTLTHIAAYTSSMQLTCTTLYFACSSTKHKTTDVPAATSPPTPPSLPSTAE